MARSEHATRRDPRDSGDLGRKRRVKHLAAEERHRPRALADRDPEVAAAGVPIGVRERDRCVHYPASAGDLRAVIGRLPPGAVEGLGGITLCLAEELTDEPFETDPLGRRTHELLPGVYCGDVLGRYRYGDRSEIELYGYTYAPGVADREVIEAFLRVRMLATLVHELGHHRDHRERIARGRWRADDTDEAEVHAEAIEHAWTLDHVIPYVEDAHPESVAALTAWLVEHTGIALPLATLLGDPRTSVVAGVATFFSVRGAFDDLLRDVQKGVRGPDARIEFARNLHYGAWYDEALAVLDRVALDHPGDDRQAVLRADILVHLDRVDEAAALAEPVLARRPDDADALEVLADIAQARGAWARVRELALREAAVRDDWRRDSCARKALRAAIELAAWTDVDAELAALRAATDNPYRLHHVDELEAFAHLRRGRHAEAFALAESLPRRTLLLAAIAFEAACHLHLGRPAERRLEWGLEHLRRTGCAAWADRLAALMA